MRSRSGVIYIVTPRVCIIFLIIQRTEVNYSAYTTVATPQDRAGPRHKRTKRLLRAPWPPEGPQVAYMKLQFILFYFNS